MLHRNRFANLLGIACLAAFTATAADLRISGPFTHENLSVYLLHSSVKKPAAPNLLTLHEAMEQKKAAVYETGKVDEARGYLKRAMPRVSGPLVDEYSRKILGQ